MNIPEKRQKEKLMDVVHFRHMGCSGVVYTMDHEVVPRKRPILRGMTSWDDFHGPSH